MIQQRSDSRDERSSDMNPTVPALIRRVVTGVDDAGRSCFVSDDYAADAIEPAPGVWLTELWESTSVPVDNADPRQGAGLGERLEPPRGGVLARIVELPPDQSWKGHLAHGAFDALRDESEREGSSADPMLHQTNTLDCIAVIKGEIYSLTEQGETLLRTGDMIIQRGTLHSWSNRSDQPCVLFAVLVDAIPR
jgi:hypothetical protein